MEFDKDLLYIILLYTGYLLRIIIKKRDRLLI